MLPNIPQCIGQPPAKGDPAQNVSSFEVDGPWADKDMEKLTNKWAKGSLEEGVLK